MVLVQNNANAYIISDLGETTAYVIGFSSSGGGNNNNGSRSEWRVMDGGRAGWNKAKG